MRDVAGKKKTEDNEVILYLNPVKLKPASITHTYFYIHV